MHVFVVAADVFQYFESLQVAVIGVRDTRRDPHQAIMPSAWNFGEHLYRRCDLICGQGA